MNDKALLSLPRFYFPFLIFTIFEEYYIVCSIYVMLWNEIFSQLQINGKGAKWNKIKWEENIYDFVAMWTILVIIY